MKKHNKELHATEKCPCNSGLKYGTCCKKKSFRWVRNAEGRIGREVPLSNEVIDLLKNHENEYIRILGRKPYKDEVLYLHQFSYGLQESDLEISKAMIEANMRPQLVYATQKTGLFVTESNQYLIPNGYLKEWNDAIDEYFNLKAQGKLEPTVYQKKLKELASEQYSFLIVIGMYLQNLTSKSNRIYRKKNPDAHFHLGACVIKIFRLLKAIQLLHERSIGGESLGLVRSIYECYIQFSYVKKFPEKASDLLAPQIGILQGDFDFCLNKQGKINRKKIIEIATGRIISNPTNYQILEELGNPLDIEIYDYLYAYLSEAVHLDINYLAKVLNEEGLDYQKIIEIDDSVKISTFLILMLLNEIRDFSSPRLQKDILVVGKRIRSIFLDFLEASMNPIDPSNDLFLRKVNLLFT